MESNRFNTWFFNPVLLNEETAVELKELTETHPWFQLDGCFMQRISNKTQSPEYETVLKKVAIRVYDRKLLSNFMNSENKPIHVPIEKENMFSLSDEKCG